MSSFRNVELSESRYEPENLQLLTFGSPSLQGRGDVTLFVPPGENLPIVLLLHGACGSHWNWAFKGGAHHTAMKLIEEGKIPPMALVMPTDGMAGDSTAYLPHPDANYETWIMEDVVDCVTEVVPEITRASSLFIAGLSMGGFGALRLGAKYSHLLSGISAHSAITDLKRDLAPDVGEPDLDHPLEHPEYSILHWMKKNRGGLPPIRFDCGKDDPLLEANRRLHKKIDELGVFHTYVEYPGGHDWEYWSVHLKDTLLFFKGFLTR